MAPTPQIAENDLLAAVAAWLAAAGLAPAPALLGVAEPAAGSELPAIVLALESLTRSGNGVGERGALVSGALPWQATIDLANPLLQTSPEEPGLRLLDPARPALPLPHGGLVKRDGSAGPLDGDDLTVKAGGVDRPVVAAPPAGLGVSADREVGRLTFATPLPAAGSVEATYFLGQWEQRLTRLAGTLRVDVCAAQAGDAAALSTAVVTALLDPGARGAIRRLLALSVTALGSVGAPEASFNLRRRTARFAFAYEQEINRPESSGGVIAAIPVTTGLLAV